MGRIELRSHAGPRLLMLLVVMSALLAGCSSSAGRGAAKVAPPPSAGAVASAEVAQPAEIRQLELTEEGSAALLRIVADRTLVWTNYRDRDGSLVVELQNAVPSSSVAAQTAGRGLVDSVAVEVLDDAERPLTRLVVRTQEASEHSLTTEGQSLRVQLVPIGYEEPVALAYEPLDDSRETAAATGTAPPPPVRASASPRAYGTADAPLQGPPAAGVVASRLDHVQVEQQGDATVVRIVGDGEFSYSSFRLENPERFVIDLTGVVNTSPRPSIQIGSDLVDQVRIGQFKPRPEPVSRVVFDLKGFAAPRLEHESDGLRVVFGQGGEMPPETVAVLEPVETVDLSEPTDQPEAVDSSRMDDTSYDPSDDDAVEVADLDEPVDTFDESAPPSNDAPPVDTASDEEIALFEAVDETPPAPAAQPAPTPAAQVAAAAPPPPVPVYDYEPAAAPPSVARPVETSDVSLFEAQQVQVGGDIREQREVVVPEFGGLVVNRQERQYVGEPISMSLKNADLVETLRSFAKISTLNFVIQPGVQGSVTVELKSVPWDQAMEQILKINNLGMEIDGTIVRIAPAAQLRAEAEERRRLEQAKAQSIPLRTVMKSLSYASASEVASLLRNRGGAILSQRGTVQVDQRTNTLILRELPGNIDTVLAVIENLDTPEPQVTIEARIIEATKTFARTLGIQWGFDGISSQQFGNTTGLQFPNNGTVTGNVGLLTGGANGFLALTMGNILNTFNLNTILQVAENEGLVNIISAPSVTTLNNSPASIQSGLQIPIQTVSNRTVSVQFVNATLQLTVRPQVTAEGTIILTINVAKRSPQLAFAIVGASNAPIATKEAQTTVIVRDGGTAVIGGIYEVSSNQNQDRVPGLANIPVLGHLFKNRSRNEDNDELMIFVTPRIVQM